MTDYTRIPIRDAEHQRLVQLQNNLAGKIDSYLSRPSLSDVIKYLLEQQEIKIMNTQTYYISEAMLGDEATEQDARRMVELLTEKGYDVEYGNRFNRTDEDDIATRDWEDALDIISQEKYA